MSDNIQDKSKLYEYIVPANEPLYKGMNESSFIIGYPEPIWFSQNKDTASRYGSFVHEVRTNRSLKLINITSPFFQSTFMDFLNQYYKNDGNAYQQKMELLVPIGLPDNELQQEYIFSNYGIVPSINTDLYKNVAFFYNRHRFSEKEMDLRLVNFLKNLHLQFKFDGYIAPCIWSSKYHAQFSDEICLFNINPEIINYVCYYQQELSGGTSTKKTYGDPLYNKIFEPVIREKLTIKSLEELRLYGWTGEYKLSKNGMLIYPDAFTLMENYKKNEIIKNTNESLKLLKTYNWTGEYKLYNNGKLWFPDPQTLQSKKKSVQYPIDFTHQKSTNT